MGSSVESTRSPTVAWPSVGNEGTPPETIEITMLVYAVYGSLWKITDIFRKLTSYVWAYEDYRAEVHQYL